MKVFSANDHYADQPDQYHYLTAMKIILNGLTYCLGGVVSKSSEYYLDHYFILEVMHSDPLVAFSCFFCSLVRLMSL